MKCRLWPTHASAHNNLATLLPQDSPEAEKHLRAALAAHPHHPRAHFNLAGILNRRGERAAAVGLLRRAIDLEPNFPEPHSLLGSIYAEELNASAEGSHPTFTTEGNLPENATLHQKFLSDRARSLHKRAVSLDPLNGDFRNNFGVYLEQVGDLQGAAFQYVKAVELSDHSGASASSGVLSIALLNGSRVFCLLSRSLEAELMWSKLTAIRPDIAARERAKSPTLWRECFAGNQNPDSPRVATIDLAAQQARSASNQ